MFVDLKARLEDAAILELLELAVFPDPDRMEKAVAEYRNGEGTLLGYESEGEIIGVIGYRGSGGIFTVQWVCNRKPG